MPPLQVNTDGVVGAIRMGCRTMRSVFNADDDGVPFFGSQLMPRAELRFSAHHSESHVPGRHLNGLLAAEAVAPDGSADSEVLDEAVALHRRALMRSYGGALPLPLNRVEPAAIPPTNFCPHNLREGFHGLYALARWRDDGEAADLAERSIETIRRLWHPQQGWDTEALRQQGLEYQACQGFVHGEARMLGPLVKLHDATGSLKALRLAEELVEKLTAELYLEDGAYDEQRFVTRHAHSVTCCLSSLAQYAVLRSDRDLLRRVQVFYDHGLCEMRDAIGWSPERCQQTGSDHGEGNNTGDILETALILGEHLDPHYDHDAERILRCHLLPSQLLDIDFIAPLERAAVEAATPAPPAAASGRARTREEYLRKSQPDEAPRLPDGLRDLARRHQGAWGFPAPYGHLPTGRGRGNLSFNMDIVGGVVGSLCEAQRAILQSDDEGHHVRLLLAAANDEIEMRVPYARFAGPEVLTFLTRRMRPLRVQLPPWVDGSKVRLDPVATPFSIDDEHGRRQLTIPSPPTDRPLHVIFPLPGIELELTHHHDQPIPVLLRGDAVAAMESFGADLRYFPTFEEHEQA